MPSELAIRVPFEIVRVGLLFDRTGVHAVRHLFGLLLFVSELVLPRALELTRCLEGLLGTLVRIDLCLVSLILLLQRGACTSKRIFILTGRHSLLERSSPFNRVFPDILRLNNAVSTLCKRIMLVKNEVSGLS